ncbi:MAG TPA: isoprenylcysteine carboxylmethyltransferase family protein [Chthoniobacteraceae bacterium]|jgi:protein-S-isoprenylcysteine O-methyltransferase Ste14|nr:isoprenylcysteine carboxylmethyltransferase family protein [Chthoniobacteraceae bacterium]
MNSSLLIWLPPVSAIAIYLARVVELGTKRQIIAGAIRENLTLRLFITLGTVMILGSLTEYYFLRMAHFSWIFLGAGWAVALFSFYIRRQAIAALGRFWSLHVEIRETHQLVREGPFRFVRHPAYSSMILEILSIALLLQSWFTALVVYACFLPTLLARIRIEEKALIDKFGDAYVQFKKTTPALIPWVGPRS